MSIEIEVVAAGPPGPRGYTGNTGPKGDKGDKGDTGDLADLDIGTVTTGSPAAASLTGNPEDGYELDLTLPSVGAGSIHDADVNAAADIDRSKIAGTALTSDSMGVYNVRDFGAVGDNTTDDTAAIQSALNATPPGSRCLVPAGRYKITHITVPEGVHLVGTGWDWLRDSTVRYGDASWQNDDYILGSVFVSTSTSGTAITASAVSTHRRIGLSGFALVGPGTGTTLGIQLGKSNCAVIDSMFSDLLVANFATGMKRENVEDCTFTNIKFHGCDTGLYDALNTNVNFNACLSMSNCDTYGHYIADTTCIGNYYANALFQGNTGTSLVINGRANVWDAPYFENPNGTAAIVFDGNGTNSGARYCEVRAPICEGANYNTIPSTVVAGASMNHVTNMPPMLFNNAGMYMSFSGRCENVTNTEAAVGTTYIREVGQERVTEPFALLNAKVKNVLSLDAGATAAIPTTGLRAGSMWYEATYLRVLVYDGAGHWRTSDGSVVY